MCGWMCRCLCVEVCACVDAGCVCGWMCGCLGGGVSVCVYLSMCLYAHGKGLNI